MGRHGLWWGKSSCPNAQLNNLQLRRDGLLVKYTKGHPTVKEVQALREYLYSKSMVRAMSPAWDSVRNFLKANNDSSGAAGNTSDSF